MLDARYEQLRHAALHARATAFPLGLGVLTGKGVTAWRRVLSCLAPAAAPDTPRTARGAVTARILGSACARTPVSYVLPLAWIYEE